MSDSAGWTHVARKELEDAGRSRLFIGVAGVLIFLSALLSAVPYLQGQSGSGAVESAAAIMQTPVSVFLPVLAAIVGYMAIVSERDSGSIRVLLGLPLSRRDVLLGKTVGRSLVLLGALLIAGVVGIVLSLALYGDVSWILYATFAFTGVVLSIIYVAVSVAISASVNSRGKAMGLVATFIIVFVYAWDAVVLGVIIILEEWQSGFVEGNEGLVLLFWSMNPGTAAARVAGHLFESYLNITGLIGGSIEGVPWYSEWYVGIPILLGWIAIPLLIGHYRFSRADL